MISSLEWIPAGIADPHPKKYELSATEQELLVMLQEKGSLRESTAADDDDDDVDPDPNDNDTGSGNIKPKLAAQKLKQSKAKSTSSKDAVASALPADLRMDEYSDDEDDDDNENNVGNDDDDDDDELDHPNEDDANDDAAAAALQIGRTAASTVGDLMDDDDSEGKGGNDDGDDQDDDDENRARPNDKDWEDIDDDDDDEDLDDIPDTREYEPIDVEGLEAMGLSHIGMNDASAYMEDNRMDHNDDDDSEAEDVLITADDALVVIAKAEDDFASLEVYVYDQRKGNLYVHHDIPLPAFPLCLAHGQVSHGAVTGNFCAVGTFSPGIEIWNLDVLNALEPSCVLGGEDTSAADDIMKWQILNAATNGSGSTSSKTQQSAKSQRKGAGGKKGDSSTGLRPGSHTDAVMALSWNQIHKQVIASGSADGTVKLWDVTKAGGSSSNGSNATDSANAATFGHHKGKVQSVAWNPTEATLLATGSYDRTVALVDARSAGSGGNGSSGSASETTDASNVKTVRISADCEALAWDPFHPEYLTVVSEDGTICCWDVRKFETSTPLWSFVASEFGGVTDLSYNAKVPGLMVTCSIDKTVTLWDARNIDTNKTTTAAARPPRSCGSKDMCGGKLYAVGFYPSSPWLLACGGSGNQLSIWDLSSEAVIQKRFQGRLSGDQTEEAIDESLQLGDDSNLKEAATAAPALQKKSPASNKKKSKPKKKVHRR